MPVRPDILPRWATDSGVVLEPPSGEKDTGWVANNKPPARKMNWLQNKGYEWFQFLEPVFAAAVRNWTERGNPKNVTLVDAAGAGSNAPGVGWTVAVGLDDGGGDAYIIRSSTGLPDGSNWLEAVNPKAFDLAAVASDGINFVAVGEDDGTDAYLIAAPQAGASWTEYANPATDLFGVVYDPVNDLWVACGAGGTIITAPGFTPPAAVTWTLQTTPTSVALRSVTVDDAGLFVAVGDADVDTIIITSPDGVTWTERTNPKNFRLEAVAWHAPTALFVAVGFNDGTDAYAINSPDGINWSEIATPFSTMSGLKSDGWNHLIATGGGDQVAISRDGATWITHDYGPVTGTNIGVGYNATLGQWVVVGTAGGAQAHHAGTLNFPPTTL